MQLVAIMYNDQHRTFLQVILNEGAVPEEQATELIFHIFNRNTDIVDIVHEINEELNTLNMMIKSAVCEVSGIKYWMLTSLVMDEMAKYQTEFTHGQLELLMKIFADIISSPHGYVSSTHCLNLLTHLDNKMPKIAGETFLNNMVSKKWLSYMDGQYFIGPRSAAELLPYFKDTFGDSLENCRLCRQVIFYGKYCNHCEKKMHTFCMAHFSNDKCPNCNTPIDEMDELPEVNFDDYTNEEMEVSPQKTVGELQDEETCDIAESQHKSKRQRRH